MAESQVKFLIAWTYVVDESGQQDLSRVEDFFHEQFTVPMEVPSFTDTGNTIILETKEELLSWAKRRFDFYTTRETTVDPELEAI